MTRQQLSTTQNYHVVKNKIVTLLFCIFKFLSTKYFCYWKEYFFDKFIFWEFFFLSFHTRPFTIPITAGKGGGYFFNSSLPLPPTSQTIRHQSGDYCSELTSAYSQQPDLNFLIIDHPIGGLLFKLLHFYWHNVTYRNFSCRKIIMSWSTRQWLF